MLGCGAAREFARSSTSARWVLYTDCDVLFPAGFAAALGRDLALLDRAGFRAAQLNFDALEPSRWGEFEFSMDKQVILNRLDRDRNGEWWRAEGDEAFDGDCEKISCIRCMQGFGMLIQRELLDQIGGFDPALDSGEDRDVAARIVAADERIAFLPRLAISHSYDFDLVRIARRKWWHGKFSALTSEKHPKLYRGSMGSCFRMLASAMTPPKCFRSPRGRVYFAVQAVSFAASHILHAALLKLRGNRGSPGSAARQFKGL
jgi:GT2 family glycosyltransferase